MMVDDVPDMQSTVSNAKGNDTAAVMYRSVQLCRTNTIRGA